MPLHLPTARPGLESLRRARCCLSDIDSTSKLLEGWILLPDSELTAVEVYLNGTALGMAKVRFRQEVADLYPRIPHAGRSGFQLRLKPGQLQATNINHVTLVGYGGRRSIARAEILLCRRELIPPTPIPPPEMIERVQGDRDGESYRTL